MYLQGTKYFYWNNLNSLILPIIKTLRKQKQLPACVCQKDALKNFALLTEKQLCHGLFLMKLQDEAGNFIKEKAPAG